MKILINLLCLVAALFIFDSCTVTKRHFGGGYHVEWKKKWNDEKDQSVAKKQDQASDTLYVHATTVPQPSPYKMERLDEKDGRSVVTDHTGLKEQESVDKPAAQNDEFSRDEIISSDETYPDEVKTASSTDDQPSVSEPKKKVEPLTWVAFAFLIAGIGFGFLPMALFSSFALPLILFFLLFLIAFINAVSSAIRISKNPEKYKAKAFTWIVLVFSSIGFVYALTTLLLYMVKGSVATFG
jgi:hypothetical protein